MGHSIEVERSVWEAIGQQLLNSDVEEAGVLFARAELLGDSVRFVGDEFVAFKPTDFDFQSAYHIELTDDARAWMIKEAWDRQLTIVEFHSHVGDGVVAEFSPSDLTGFREFVPHVRWRLRSQPYAAVVVSATGFDSLVWSGASASATGPAVIIADHTIHPTGLSAKRRIVTNVR